MSPAVLSFFTPDLESERLSVLVLATSCGVDRPEARSSSTVRLVVAADDTSSLVLCLA